MWCVSWFRFLHINLLANGIIGIWSDTLPLSLVWLSGLLRSVGGGEPVIDSIMCVMVMDVFEESDRLVFNTAL